MSIVHAMNLTCELSLNELQKTYNTVEVVKGREW